MATAAVEVKVVGLAPAVVVVIKQHQQQQQLQ